jgi:hypothetical protein
VRRRLALVLLVVAGVAAGTAILAGGPRVAHANGRFPRTVKLVPRPGHPQEMLLGVTFGVVHTTDDGAHWQWMCESGVGFEGTFDPDYELTAQGTMLATTFRGVQISHDGGCHWDDAPAPLGEKYLPVLAVGPDDAIYGAASDADDNRIFKSVDDGRTFTPVGAVGLAGDWWTSIEVAPSDAQRVYLAGYRMAGDAPRQRILFRSTNGGQSWTELPTTALAGTDISDLQIAAISPTDPGRVIMRVTLSGIGTQETLYLSENAGTTAAGGPTWVKVLEVIDNIPGVVIRRDGTVWAGTPNTGNYKSTDGGRTFAVVPDLDFETRCLTERADGVMFVCANDLTPGSAALMSSTTGAVGTWGPRLRFADIAAPVSCAAGTRQHDDCEELLWCGLSSQLGITAEPIECPSLVDAGIDAGTGGPPEKSCCDSGGGPASGEVGLVLFGLVTGWRRRRTRRRSSPRAL